jgi:hypothetical protein
MDVLLRLCQVQVEVHLRPTVSRKSVLVPGTHLGPVTNSAGNPSGTRDQFFLSR